MNFHIHQGDALAVLRSMPDASVHCCITSPPYWGLRDYGCAGQLGLERTPAEYVEKMVEVFREVRRVLRDDGTLWLNLGDSYSSGDRNGHGTRVGFKQSSNRGANDDTSPVRLPAGAKPKDLVGIPWRVALALQADGWYWRDCIVWHKPAPMPESVRDRCTKSWEPIFMFAKSERYYFDADSISEQATCDRMRGPADHPDKVSTNGNSGLGRPAREKRDKQAQLGKRTYTGFNSRWDESEANGTAPTRRNKRNVWTLSPMATPDAHFATFPLELPETCLKAGCPEDGTVLDPFAGAGTTGLACLKQSRNFVGIELNPKYIEIAHNRARKYYPLLMEASA